MKGKARETETRKARVKAKALATVKVKKRGKALAPVKVAATVSSIAMMAGTSRVRLPMRLPKNE